MLKWLSLFSLLCVTPAMADYVIRDGNGNVQTIKAGTCGNEICPQSSPADSLGNPISNSNPLPVSQATGSLITTNQVSCGSTATALFSADSTHVERSVSNVSGSTVYIGGAAVSSSTGYAIPTGTTQDVTRFTGALYCIVATGSDTLSTLSY
jgi:hypothetical protein